MPPTMPLQQHRPRQLHAVLGRRQVVAEDVIHVPEEEAGQEHEHACPAIPRLC